MNGVPAGNCYLVTNNNGQSNYLNEWWTNAESSPDCNQAESFTVNPGGLVAGKNFKLDLGGSLSGRVIDQHTGQAIPNASVCISDSDLNNTYCVQTDENSNYHFFGLSATYYYVWADGMGNFEGEWKQKYLAEYYNESAEDFGADLVAVTAGLDTPSINFTLEQAAIISGRITDSNGNPIQGVCLAVVTDPCQWDWVTGATTDENGVYTIMLPGGTYFIHADAGCGSATNYIAEWWNNGDGTMDCTQAQSFEVRAGADPSGKDFELVLGGGISGKVVRQDNNQPIANALVCFSDSNWSNGYCVQTDASGNYQFSGLSAPSSYYVSANGSVNFEQEWKQKYLTEYYNESGEQPGADLVPVTAGQNTGNINFTLEQAAIISGRVTNSDGQPVQGVCFGAYSDDPCQWNYQGGTPSGQDGYYSILITPGTYYIRSDPQCNSLNYVPEWWNNGDGTMDCGQAVSVNGIAGQETGDIDFVLDTGGSVSGRVTDAQGNPIQNLHVNANTEQCGGLFLGWSSTDENGNYRLVGLPVDTEHYIRTCSGCSGLNYVDESYSNVVDCNRSTPVSIAAGQDTPGIDFSLSQSGTISGFVFGSSGAVIADTQISIHASPSDQSWNGRGTWVSQSDGSFTISGLLPGTYRVLANNNRAPGYETKYYISTYDYNAATEVLVTAGNTTNLPNNIFLESTDLITGYVYESDGITPVVNGCVNVSSTAPNWNQVTGFCCTGADGAFAISVPPGDYYLRTHADCQGSNPGLVDEWYATGGSNPDGNYATAVHVVSGVTTSGVNFSLDRAPIPMHVVHFSSS